jgi:hypothetical protein
MGPAGQLADDLLVAAMNTVKHANRQPAIL